MIIINGDCLEVMRGMEANSIDFIVTDPPYGLHFMNKDWDSFSKGKNLVGRKVEKAVSNSEAHNAARYDSKRDCEFQDFMTQVGFEMLRIVKPGGHCAMFGSPRRHHRQMSGLENAGWEIRDCLMWIYGSGFPKSHNKFGLKGYGTALKPAYEPIILAMKPLDGTFAQNAEKWGVAGINIDDNRVGIGGTKRSHQAEYPKNKDGTENRSQNWARTGHSVEYNGMGRWPANLILDEEAAEMLDEQSGDKSRYFFIALKDKSVIINACDTQEELSLSGKKTVNEDNNQNIDSSGNKPMGLFLLDTISIIKMETHSIIIFPILNVLKRMLIGTFTLECERIIKESEISNIESVSIAQNGESLIYFQNENLEPIKGIAKNVVLNAYQNGEKKTENIGMNIIEKEENQLGINIIKNISKKTEIKLMPEDEKDITKTRNRFFYCAKASSNERGKDNTHPTVKPISLMKYIIKLLAPQGSPILLDPFTGSGSTLVAAKELGINAIGIEKQEEYCEIARKRIEFSPK